MNKVKKEDNSKNKLLYVGLAAVGMYGLFKMPFLRTLVMPALIGVATKYAGDHFAPSKATAKA